MEQFSNFVTLQHKNARFCKNTTSAESCRCENTKNGFMRLYVPKRSFNSARLTKWEMNTQHNLYSTDDPRFRKSLEIHKGLEFCARTRLILNNRLQDNVLQYGRNLVLGSCSSSVFAAWHRLQSGYTTKTTYRKAIVDGQAQRVPFEHYIFKDTISVNAGTSSISFVNKPCSESIIREYPSSWTQSTRDCIVIGPKRLSFLSRYLEIIVTMYH